MKRKISLTQKTAKVFNDNQKKFNRSLSGVIRYAKNEGKEDFQKYIDAFNDKHNTNYTINRLCDKKTILKYYSKDKDGNKRTSFNWWQHIKPIANKLLQESKTITKNSNNKVKKAA